MYQIVFIRHGESEWNKKNLFCGWVDVPLSLAGERECHRTGKMLLKKKYFFDYAFASPLRRSIETLNIILEEMDLGWIPVVKPWQLLERHYGDLTGKNKTQTLKKFGPEQFMKWRRGYDTPPPPISKDNPYKKIIEQDPIFKGIKIPKSECLADVAKRVIPYWRRTIVPKIKQGKKIILVGHGNDLRALVQYLDDVSNEEIVKLNLPLGIPLVYQLDKNLRPIKHYYLGDQKKIKRMIAAVEKQGRK